MKRTTAPTPKLYCTCRKPYNDAMQMIACDGCDEWYHFECVGISDAAGLDSYICTNCIAVPDDVGGDQDKEKTKKTKPKPKLYCVCRKPYKKGHEMIACDCCDEWYHFECIGLAPEAARAETFMCKSCASLEHCVCRKGFDNHMTSCTGCEKFFHPSCVGMPRRAKGNKEDGQDKIVCLECKEIAASPAGQALQNGLKEFLQEMKVPQLQPLMNKAYKSTTLEGPEKVEVAPALAASLKAKNDRETAIEKLIKYALAAGIVRFLESTSSELLQAFLKKKSLAHSGSKQQLAERVHGMWYMPEKLPAVSLAEGETAYHFVVRTHLLQLFYRGKLIVFTEEKHASKLGHKSLDNYIAQRHWTGLTSASKSEKMKRILKGLNLVDEMRDFVSLIACDLLQPIIEPTETIETCAKDKEAMIQFVDNFGADAIKLHITAYDLKNKEKSGKKAGLVETLVEYLQNPTIGEAEEIAKRALALGKEDGSNDPLGYYSILAYTAKELLLKAFPNKAAWTYSLVGRLEAIGELDPEVSRSALCHEIDPLIKEFVEISLGDDIDQLLTMFDGFSISPMKKKAMEKEKKKQEQKILKEKEKKKQLRAEKKAMPKRALSAYTLFSMEIRPTLLAENPEATFGQVSQLAAGMWKKLSKPKTKPFLERAESDKERYEAEMVEWRKTQKPKRALSGYMLFVKAKRNEVAEQQTDLDFAAIGRLIGRMWRELSEEERQPFVTASEEDVKRYQKEFAEWQQRTGNVGTSPAADTILEETGMETETENAPMPEIGQAPAEPEPAPEADVSAPLRRSARAVR